MYAARRLYVKRWDFTPAEERYLATLTRGGKPVPGIEPLSISSIDEEVMYWRKANHIHAWFVDNVQDGEDNCGDYHVSWEKLGELLRVCERVLEASELVDGMVYTGTVYDKDHPDGSVEREPGKVIKDATVAQKLLPTREGFFFGDQGYDEIYYDDVKDTHAWAGRMLADHRDGVPGDIYYSSSW